jgi:hypothetical protein
MPTVKRPKALRAHQPRLFDAPPVQHDPGQMIRACVRSEYPWTKVQRDIFRDMLRDVQRFGRLSTPQHRLLLVFARKCGVGPS